MKRRAGQEAPWPGRAEGKSDRPASPSPEPAHPAARDQPCLLASALSPSGLGLWAGTPQAWGDPRLQEGMLRLSEVDTRSSTSSTGSQLGRSPPKMGSVKGAPSQPRRGASWGNTSCSLGAQAPDLQATQYWLPPGFPGAPLYMQVQASGPTRSYHSPVPPGWAQWASAQHVTYIIAI